MEFHHVPEYTHTHNYVYGRQEIRKQLFLRPDPRKMKVSGKAFMVFDSGSKLRKMENAGRVNEGNN